MRSLSMGRDSGSMSAVFRPCSGLIARVFAALMLVALSSCGGSGSPSVALSNMVPIRVALHLPGQPLAQVDQNMIDKILDLAIPDANAIINLAGFKSAQITISGVGFTPNFQVIQCHAGRASDPEFPGAAGSQYIV